MSALIYGYPQRIATASLKPMIRTLTRLTGLVLSAANRCGLIEAAPRPANAWRDADRTP